MAEFLSHFPLHRQAADSEAEEAFLLNRLLNKSPVEGIVLCALSSPLNLWGGLLQHPAAFLGGGGGTWEGSAGGAEFRSPSGTEQGSLRPGSEEELAV